MPKPKPKKTKPTTGPTKPRKPRTPKAPDVPEVPGTPAATILTDDNTEYRLVNLRDLRPIRGRTRKIKNHPLWRGTYARWKAGTLTCVELDSRLYVVDGWQTKERMDAAFVITAVVHVIPGLSVPEIHELFLSRNVNRQGTANMDTFRHGYLARHATETTIVTVLRDRGFNVAMHDRPTWMNNLISAHAALVEIYKTYGEARLGQVFDVIRARFIVHPLLNNPEAEAKKYVFLVALADALSDTSTSDAIAAFTRADSSAQEITEEGTHRARHAGSDRKRIKTLYTANVIRDIFANRPWQVMTVSTPSQPPPLGGNGGEDYGFGGVGPEMI